MAKPTKDDASLVLQLITVLNADRDAFRWFLNDFDEKNYTFYHTTNRPIAALYRLGGADPSKFPAAWHTLSFYKYNQPDRHFSYPGGTLFSFTL